jgi:RNA polymerase sigma factor (sigma-70 family)
MVQEGIIGLVRAAEKYDHRRGFRFSTYAYPWINQHLQRSTENRGSLISYPAHVIQEINTLHRVRMQEQEKTGQEPAVTHLAGLTGLEPDKINRLRRLSNITVSMNHPEAEETDLQMAANLPDPDSGRAQRESENSSLKRLLWDRLSMLEEREQTVICGRWGLDGRPQRTFAQLADQLQVSREWVRQLERTALKKLGREQLLSEAYELSQTPG